MHKPVSMQSFVQTARLLVLVQIVVGGAAAATALWATKAVFDYTEAKTQAEDAEAKYTKEKIAAKKAAEEAETAREDASAERRRADKYTQLAVRSRNVLQATSPADFREAAIGLESELENLGAGLVGDESEVSLLALLATAQFNSDVPEKNRKALRTIDRAININSQRINRLEWQINPSSYDYNETIYLDKLAYECADMTEAEKREEGGLLNIIQTFPPPVRLALVPPADPGTDQVKSERIAEHFRIRRECSASQLTWITNTRVDTGPSAPSASLPPRTDFFKVKKVSVRAGDEMDDSIVDRLKTTLKIGYELEVFERVQSSYKPGVRYFYSEQEAQAEEIREKVRASYGEEWPDTAFDVVLLKGYQGIRRDQVEVWLPYETRSPSPVAVPELAEEVLSAPDIEEISVFPPPVDAEDEGGEN
jgi:hypothetical protein